MTAWRDVSHQRLVEIRRSGGSDGAKNVLIVEDNEDSRTALADALEHEGYEVAAVANGVKALDSLRWHRRPGCVVMDMRMPVMTGWELRVAMEADPRLRHIPAIGMTGGRWKPEDARHFVSLMNKPVKLDELLAGLEAAFRISVSIARSESSHRHPPEAARHTPTPGL